MKKTVLIWILGAGAVLPVLGGCETPTRQMSRGEILYSVKCSSCHRLIARERFDGETWGKYVSRYGKKMTAEERTTLLNYLAGDADSMRQAERISDAIVESNSGNFD